MQVTPELLFAAAIAAVAFLCGVFYLRSRNRRTRSVGRRVSRGPANLRFTCAGCSGQFTHSRRTLAAWEKGTRKFFCHACHTKWRGTRPAAPNSGVMTGPRGERAAPAGAATGERSPAGRNGRGGGCLGAVLLLAFIPVGLAAALWHFT